MRPRVSQRNIVSFLVRIMCTNSPHPDDGPGSELSGQAMHQLCTSAEQDPDPKARLGAVKVNASLIGVPVF